MDVFDKFVGVGDSVCLGEAVIRRYQVSLYTMSLKKKFGIVNII